MKIARLVTVAVLGLGLALVAPAHAVALRFQPVDTTVAVGASGRLSVMIDETVTVRTIDVTVAFDTTYVKSLGGGAGTLYTTSGYQLFRGFEMLEPGVWHGYCIVMGAGLSVAGPGELFYWNFEGLADGISPITTVSVYLSDVAGDWYPTVELPGTTIIVGDGALADVPAPAGLQGLRLAPNPFNPRTTVGGQLDAAAPVRVTVHDARGRLVTVLHDGMLEAGAFSLAWDGRDATGQAAAGGVYLFLLEGAGAPAATKGVLLK